jgi:DNA (cytosine-5)-methyltransferase 1
VRSVSGKTWLQSSLCRTYQEYNKLCYRLTHPDQSYLKWYFNFEWTANLAKYFIDFLDCHLQASLRDFKVNFSTWLIEIHGSDILPWFQQYGCYDMRLAVTSHARFLWKEACGHGLQNIQSHPIWGEISDYYPTLIRIPKEAQKKHKRQSLRWLPLLPWKASNTAISQISREQARYGECRSV